MRKMPHLAVALFPAASSAAAYNISQCNTPSYVRGVGVFTLPVVAGQSYTPPECLKEAGFLPRWKLDDNCVFSPTQVETIASVIHQAEGIEQHTGVLP